MERKSIRQWLKTLPEPYKREALLNATLRPNENIDVIEYSSLMDALYYGFEWGISPEGHDYWEDAREKARYGKF